MYSKGSWQITVGLVLLAATVFVLPMSLFEVATGVAAQGALVMFVVGLSLLLGSFALIAVGLSLRSRNLRTARSYHTREPSSSDGDRPVNPHALPNSYGAIPPLG